MEILENIVWTFTGNEYPNYESFDNAVMQYQQEIKETNASWEPGKVVVNNPSVDIIYQYYQTENDIVFNDEIDLGLDESFETEQKIVRLELFADNNKFFTALELLFKIHHRLAKRDLGDDIYFEGLASLDNSEKLDPPLWQIVLGS